MPGPEEGEEAARLGAFEQQARDAQQRAAAEGGLEGAQGPRFFDGPRFNEYRPLEELSRRDVASKLEEHERQLIKEALTDTILTPFLTFSSELNSIVEGASAKKYMYSAQGGLERMMYTIAQTEGQIHSAKSEQNEVVLGAVLSEQVRQKSVLTIHNWALPYLATYWGGMDSMRLLSERGAQLPMADMARFHSGAKDKWVTEGLKKYSIDPQVIEMIPLTKTEKGTKEIKEQKKDETGQNMETAKTVETLDVTETFTDRLSRYTSDSDFWTRIRGEMNTHNPILGGKEKEKLYISEAMQQFVADFSTKQPRTNEDGSKEKKMPPRKLTIYFDDKGQQIQQQAFDENGVQLRTKAEADAVEKGGGTVTLRLESGRAFAKKAEIFVENLDYFNIARSENERRWVIATTAAMCIENAKEILDSLPPNVNSADENSEAGKRYKKLIQDVTERANQIMENYDVFRKSSLEQKIAMTAFNLSYAISFGSFSVGDIGWKYEWTYSWSDEKKGFVWSAEGSQGDPTASGDAFTARRPYFHEVVYAAVKNRVSANNAGPLMPVDGTRAQELASALLSETEEINQRNVMVEILKKGGQPHIARYFGMLGAYEKELGGTPGWQEGARKRIAIGKTANPNLIKTIEESVMYIPTPFKDASGNYLYYPMIMPQFQIGLFDMLSVGKDISVGDLLRKTWKKDANGILVEASPADGGKRLTQRDIDWIQYAGYADDSRAVNDNFISQAYAPLYGALNSKNVEALVSNPVAGITTIIKAIDIGTRGVIKKLKGGEVSKRPTFEIMYGSSVMFQNLAFGVHNLLGRGGVKRYKDFIRDVTPGEKKDRTPDNLYTVIRSIEDFLKNKQGYDHYSDSFYLTMLAMAESLEPIVLASDTMAHTTTERMKAADTTDIKGWNGIYDKNQNL